MQNIINLNVCRAPGD